MLRKALVRLKLKQGLPGLRPLRVCGRPEAAVLVPICSNVHDELDCSAGFAMLVLLWRKDQGGTLQTNLSAGKLR